MESSTKDPGASEKTDPQLERSHSMADAERIATKNTDAVELAHLGYKDELQRCFSLASLLGLCLCLMGTWEACSASIAAALTSGGPPYLWYKFILSFLFTLAIGASLAEIASIYPTSGGQYHWVTDLSPARGRKTASWITG
ncbi:HNM1-choline permease [Fusarium denticulatum]|uniref:HNM1-choline permease n=1 Tax=Fusarium denticulatum TaxID=48507 RepID=A0A8H5U3P9_9HYPO|nr:HNM1-choline permease [Fusarium denticulatum]